MRRLEGKVALVTGAARGIGEAIARVFAHEGAHVMLSDIRDAEGQAAAKAIGPNASYYHLDVRVELDWKRVMVQILLDHGWMCWSTMQA
jgi:NAD(P)-dependent dehydrogenase (short-subunit alcohol dehydrogenase family)